MRILVRESTAALRRCMRRVSVTILTGSIVGAPVAAQTESTGTVAGRVHAADGRPLADATVELADAHLGTFSDQRGNFRLGNVRSGSHIVIVEYFGFAPDSLRVDVRGGQTEEENVTLTPKAIALAPLVVKGRVQGQARGLMEQRTAPRIEEVATADVIQSRPDANVADAIGRLPGVALERDEGEGKYLQIRGTQPSFSNVTIDGANVPPPEGDTRTVKLDIIPASIVSEVQLNKTLTADMDADAIGGTVNLKTKTPERGEPVSSLTLLGGHTDLRNNGAYSGNALFGNRFGPDGKLGFLVTGSWDKNNRPIDDVEPVFDTGELGGATVPIVAEVDERLYSYQRQRWGGGGTLDYRLNDHSSLYLHTLYSLFHNYGVRYRNDAVPSDGNVTPTSATSGTALGGTISREVQTRTPSEQIFSLIGGGNHELTSGVKVDYSASYSHSQQRVANGRNTAFAMDGVDYSYDSSNPKVPTFSVTNGAPIADPTAFAFDKFDIQNNLTTDHEVAAEANVAVPYAWGTRPANLKFGVKVRDEVKERTNNDSIFDGYNGSFTLADALSGVSDPGFYYDHYTLGPVPGAPQVQGFEDTNRANFDYNAGKSLAKTEGANFHGSEKVYALYGEHSLDVGALNLLAGVRVESTRADYTGNVVQLDSHGAYLGSTPESGTHSYTNVFPSVHLKYAFDPRTSLRFAVTEGIARPAFADLAPYLVTSQGLKTLTEGNPNLQPTHSANIDLMFDHYSGSIGVFSVGLYYKKISDFIFTRRELLASGQYAGYFASQPQNGDHGHILGAEIELQHRFTSLPGALSGLGLDGNLNVSDSRATVPSGDTGVRFAAMPRQGKTNANLELTYDRSRVSFRGGLTYNAKNIWEYGDDASGDVYLDNHLQFDANATVEMTPDVRLVVQGLNLSNEVFGFYQGSAATPIQREFYGRTLFIGFRYSR